MVNGLVLLVLDVPAPQCRKLSHKLALLREGKKRKRKEREKKNNQRDPHKR